MIHNSYFPDWLHFEAHRAYCKEKSIDPIIAGPYFYEHPADFIEVTFAYVEGEPFPIFDMEKLNGLR